MSTERERLVERHEMVGRDIEELTQQVEDGELDSTTADQLLADYKAELKSIAAKIAALPAEKKKPAAQAAATGGAAAAENGSGRSVRRVVVGSVFIIAALSVAIFLAARDTTPDEPSPAATGPAGTIDPGEVTNEQLEAVIAANPDIPQMRMALADRYFAAQEYGAALDHYLIIAASDTDPTDESLVLARIGWIAHATGLPEDAAQYIADALAIDPHNGEATLYRGFITFYGLADPEAAIPQLEEALAIPGLDPGTIAQIETALAEARQGDSP